MTDKTTTPDPYEIRLRNALHKTIDTGLLPEDPELKKSVILIGLLNLATLPQAVLDTL